MAILSDIQSKISRMDGATFQQFGDELLERIYHPINVECRGSMIGKEKTVKGCPDSIFVLQDGKVMIEYTTKSYKPKKMFLSKIESDIKDCLDERKTKVPIDEIREIVIFVNQRISIDTQDYLRNKCMSSYPTIRLTFFTIDDITLVIRRFPNLLQEYLGVKDFSYIIELDTFIKQYASPKISLPIPLNNVYFEIENLSVSDGVNKLEDIDILVISGNAGMGKTRYAIEIAKQYALKTDAQIYVIEEKGQNITESLNSIDLSTSYIFIIDDANRTSVWGEVIDFYRNTSHTRIKIIATVRSYAIDSVVDKCYELKKFGQIQILSSSEGLIKKILLSFGIKNPVWHKRINDITHGNIRLSVMCAQIPHNEFSKLKNVEDIYDSYYTPILKDLRSNQEDQLLIKVLAVISFYKVVDLVDDSLMRLIESIFGMSRVDFSNACTKLDHFECIDISEEGTVVTIPDQNFGTYVFYQCFFVSKLLSLSSFLEHLYRSNVLVIDSIFPIMNCFQKEQVLEYMKKSVSDAWNNVSQSSVEELHKAEFLELLGTFISAKTFVYVDRLINELDIEKSNRLINSPSNKIISILSKFSHSEEYDIRCALSLIIKYLEKKPTEFENSVKIIIQNWVYDEDDYLYEYKRLTIIINKLIELASVSDIGLRFASSILPEFLKFCYPINKTKGNKFIVGQYQVVITDVLLINRKKVWNWIIPNIVNMNPSIFFKDLYGDFFRDKSSAKRLITEEIDFVNSTINNIDINSDFKLCISLNDFINRVSSLIGKNKIVVDWGQANPLYLLDCQIKKGKEYRSIIGIDIEKKNIGLIIKSKSYFELKELLDNISMIAELEGRQDPLRISFVIEDLMSLDVKTAFQLWQYSINKGYNYIPMRILSTYLGLKYDISDLIKFIEKQELETKSDLILGFIGFVDKPSMYITVQDFYSALVFCRTIPFDFYYLVHKYFMTDNYNKGIRISMTALMYRVRSGRPIMGAEKFCEEFYKLYPSKVKLIECAYIYALKQREFFDNDLKLLKDILKNNPYFWVICCEEIESFVKDNHIEPYEFIWEIDNYSQIIEETLLHYGKGKWIPYDEVDNLFSFFYNLKGNTAAEFIDSMIVKYCTDRNISRILFEIVIECLVSTRIKHYITFIINNDNIEDFKLLDLSPKMMYGSDSFATAVKANLDFVAALIDKISSLNDIKYIEHILYITGRKESLEKEYKDELKQGHKNRLYNLS